MVQSCTGPERPPLGSCPFWEPLWREIPKLDRVTDPVAALILDEARALDVPDHPVTGVVVLDDAGGEISAQVSGLWDNVVGYCDSLIDEQRLPIASTETLEPAALAGVNIALMRTPKSLAALEEYAQRLAKLPGVRLVAGGRVKHLSRGMNKVLEARFGEVRASLGRQKARVLHAGDPRPGPIGWPQTRYHPRWGLTVAAYGHTFAQTAVDPGTALLLEHLDAMRGERLAIDLGCGNGVIAVSLARRGFTTAAVDISRAAVAATARTAELNGVQVRVSRADGLSGFAAGSVDLIACNPPFHVGTAKDTTPAFSMFTSAARAMCPGASMWTVFNSHLPYLPALRRVIGPTRIAARNARYILTHSVRG